MKLTQINNHTVAITFTDDWQIEQTEDLAKHILSYLDEHQVLEKVIGADRFDCRFRFLQCDFVLHFEHYSESCWIEAQDRFNQRGVQDIVAALIKAQ
ncbi:DUF3630 family protein [Thalassotalea ponticola]|uniref:DUF3630 family protein n=1 Tax=Thalassotalea ponticola TaxID=1523392 RepID=UPI0025B32B71|nr:DUF3630 family protein [Thalassotalea ponticola]MDN3652972.1 DUF3630 family protein [Thalassotalea ponticola]